MKPITGITVTGFKSLRDETYLRIAPLTLLAGANSAGKSSIMQALLLIKQTQEATHDPGGLLLDGPCLHAKNAQALLWHGRTQDTRKTRWSLELHYGENRSIYVMYHRQSKGGFVPERTIERREGVELILEHGLSSDEIIERLKKIDHPLLKILNNDGPPGIMRIVRLRTSHSFEVTNSSFGKFALASPVAWDLASELLHLPGLRGNPERAYVMSRSEGPFSGAFQSYAASVMLAWQTQGDPRATKVGEDMATLGLTWKVEARRIPQSDTEVELLVGRLPKAQKGGSQDLVNVADVGFGVSQVLPVLVALHVANPGQIVHIEQPELHLHPRAQVAMAQLLVQAANRGLRVVVETHAPLLLMAIQLAVAKGEIPASDISLNWFSRDEDGATQIREGQMDAMGAYDDWPVDFATVERELMRAYIETALRDA